MEHSDASPSSDSSRFIRRVPVTALRAERVGEGLELRRDEDRRVVQLWLEWRADNLARLGRLTPVDGIWTAHQDGVRVEWASSPMAFGWLQVVPGEVQRRHHEHDQREE